MQQCLQVQRARHFASAVRTRTIPTCIQLVATSVSPSEAWIQRQRGSFRVLIGGGAVPRSSEDEDVGELPDEDLLRRPRELPCGPSSTRYCRTPRRGTPPATALSLSSHRNQRSSTDARRGCACCGKPSLLQNHNLLSPSVNFQRNHSLSEVLNDRDAAASLAFSLSPRHMLECPHGAGAHA